MRLLGSYLITLGTFIAIDGVWLGLIASGFYKKQLGSLMSANPNWLAAIIFYLIFIAGLLYFVIEPLGGTASTLKLFLSGALFGLVTYATYDLTNLATLKDWPLTVTIVDLAWGSVLSGSVVTVATAILKNLKWL